MYENENYTEKVNQSTTEPQAAETQTAAEPQAAETQTAAETQANAKQYETYQTGGVYSAAQPPKEETPRRKKEKKGTFRKLLFSACLGLMFGAFAAAGFVGVKIGSEYLLAVFAPQVEVSKQDAVEADDSNANQITNVNQITYVQDDVSDVVEEVMPAMVSIINNYTATSVTMWGQSYSKQATSSGSGIIVGESDTELLIVSNNHVVENAETLEVTFIDGSTAAANIKGLDSDMDLAVIAVALDTLSEDTRKAITVAALGDSDNLKLGTPVIAIGNALGFGQSVTTGIVSALDREITYDDGSTGKFIQTDAAINQGNSGGALLNINGEVIGINSSKIGGTMVEGMGYAIPITSASPIVAELMERETRVEVPEEERGYMGITMQNVTEQIMQMYGMPEGVFVYSVEKDSAADRAGIKRSDIIVKVDGAKVTTGSDIQELMQYYKAGDTITITVKRAVNGEYESHDIEVVLGSRPKSE